jgi:YVTN family beta-propeller protein
VTATLQLEGNPYGIVVTPDGKKIYVTNNIGTVIYVIDTTINELKMTISNVGFYPAGVAVTPDGKYISAANPGSNNVSIIDTATNKVTATVPVESEPWGVAVTPDGTKVYVANEGSGTVSVIDISTDAVAALPISVGSKPYAFGQFIAPA